MQKDAYLLELSRYLVLNPVRARTVGSPEEWFWSSYRAALGLGKAAPWLETDWLLAQLGRERDQALKGYVAFVAAGGEAASPLEEVRHQLFLGDDAFVAQFQDAKAPKELAEVSRAQRRPMAKPLSEYATAHADRAVAMALAYLGGGYTMKEIADYFGVHYMTVSQAVRQQERHEMLECENSYLGPRCRLSFWRQRGRVTSLRL